jgi:hypothetical protein
MHPHWSGARYRPGRQYTLIDDTKELEDTEQKLQDLDVSRSTKAVFSMEMSW